MFTGIVQSTGEVAEVRSTPGGVRLLISAASWSHRPKPGDSISVSGCCLTLAEPAANARLAFDVVPETLSKTTLGSLAAGSRVNLEPSVAASGLMDGHLVQGHVEGVGVVERVRRDGGEHRVIIRPPPSLMEFMVPKGSVSVDGVSLTLAQVDPDAGLIEVALIPTTLRCTTLGDLVQGSRCNVESDIMARTAVHWLRHYAGSGR